FVESGNYFYVLRETAKPLSFSSETSGFDCPLLFCSVRWTIKPFHRTEIDWNFPKMNQPNEGSNPDASPSIPVKRKRGRPRKDKSLNQVDIARVPPGFRPVSENQPRRVNPIDDANDVVIGQVVTGVVEATFEAGYLLAVKIGNSNTSLRGVVFKPGHFAPITADNDVAPHANMIRRNAVHLPTENRARVRGRKRRSREWNEQHMSYPGNGTNQVHGLAPQMALVSTKPKQAPVVAAPSVPLVGSRGTVVPVVLQPVNLSNGLPPGIQVSQSASQDAHMQALKGKHVQTVVPLAVYPPNGSISVSQTQSSPNVTPNGQRDNGPFNQVTSETGQGDVAKPKKSSNVLMSNEISKGVQGSSQSSEEPNLEGKAACASSAEDSAAPEREIGDMNEPLFVEPLRTFHSGLHNQSASIFKALENRGGRMTELLQAVQENLNMNQVPQTENLATGLTVEFHEQKSSETDSRDEETP
ncbi:hypothetical protein RJ639_039411, partial [Escallonia herrerae]